MSVVAHAHQQSQRRHGKRGLDADSGPDEAYTFRSSSPAAKARRVLSAARCTPGAGAFAPHLAHAIGPTTVAALHSLFPAMNEQTISQVLTDCGSDIDAAIKRLGQLQLRAEGKSEAQHSASAPATPSSVSPRDGVVPGATAVHASESAAAGASPATAAAASVATDAASQQQLPLQQQPQQPKTSEEWVDALVHTMSQATDMADARARAAQALQAFEQAVTAQTKAAPHSSQLEALQRDNAILKRAVAIQNSRMQEMAGREAEVVQLRAVAKEYHDKVQALELSNYSLAQHLRAATDSRPFGAGPNSDVF